MTHQICRNCGEQVDSNYCLNCGQKNDIARLSWSALADGFLSSFIGDGAIGEKRSNVRYGFMLTLWSILTRPGRTVSEYIEGRRRKYFNPVTILFLISTLYVLAGQFSGIIKDRVTISTNPVIQFINQIIDYVINHPAAMYLILLPFTALAYKWIFGRRSDLHYIEYAYVGIFGAIISIIMLFIKLPFQFDAMESYSGWATGILFFVQGAIVVSIFRQLFGTTIKQSIWRWALATIIAYTLAIMAIITICSLLLICWYLTDIDGFNTFVGTIKPKM